MTFTLDRGAGVAMRGLYDSRYYDVVAQSNSEAYRVFVGGPLLPFVGEPEGGEDTRHPVIYVLDGKLNFAIVHAQVQILSAMRQMPPAFVVGVGYAGDESFFEKDGFRRQGDLTPNAGGELEAEMKAMNRALGVTHGGADAFLAFLCDELKLALESAYPASRTDTTILGNSLGGLFASWVLLHEPDRFQRYVIVSPSWWWNDYEVWAWEAAYAAAHHDLPARVFATFGGLETAARHKAILERSLQLSEGEARKAIERTLARSDDAGWMRGAELIPELQAKMDKRGYPGLNLTTLVLPDETHESIPGSGFSRGLRAVFGSWQPGG
ncbi:alpha/beta hydrolase-fold protein [Phenylobacterium sp.]|uniref:alpha/beta hydrolase n=1 Tax=Phenylobacterium sp. TaxID=1871053 RepID=UPI0025CCED31|nr:alpha/beta hydrolase-fold protein [Phenylobacterium sp.]